MDEVEKPSDSEYLFYVIAAENIQFYDVKWVGFRLDKQEIEVCFLAGTEIFIFFSASRPSLRPVRSSSEWDGGGLFSLR
jgi:hypothetical protein